MRELRKDIDLTKKGGRTDARRNAERVQIYEFHGREPRKVQEFLTKVYAENEFKSVGERAHFRTDSQRCPKSGSGCFQWPGLLPTSCQPMRIPFDLSEGNDRAGWVLRRCDDED
jgi:hypothetical protein